jgi:Ca2+:H+ antiporter
MADDEILSPQLAFPVALALFVATIILLFFCIDATVSSLSALTEDSGAGLSSTFVGLILLPVPNYDFAAVSLASEDVKLRKWGL